MDLVTNAEDEDLPLIKAEVTSYRYVLQLDHEVAPPGNPRPEATPGEADESQCSESQEASGIVHSAVEEGDGEPIFTEMEVRTREAAAWDTGRRTGTSRAMRYMSDEPNVALASADDNPYSQRG